MARAPPAGIMLHCTKEPMTDSTATLAPVLDPATGGAHPARGHRPGRDGSPPSATSLTRLLRRLAARHADMPDIIAVCEKWAQRVATIECRAQSLEGA